ncbi:hypothetical protein [Streptomyces monomycini]|uniref:hypothetical protein n=1 Tax=Streptomyces monomycini TaxID=371720 RepID=UPI00067B28D1|nr:hypothetical protein [Streptomyces monomycini]
MSAATYRKKPIEITAMQWTEDVPHRELITFTNGLVQLNDVDHEFRVYDRLHDTWVAFTYGDWIIQGVQGEYYPCAPAVFAASYEPVASEPEERPAFGYAVTSDHEVAGEDT